MVTRAPCATDEWYHTYNRGVDKRIVFNEPRDYERFLMLLYTGNVTNAIVLHETAHPTLENVIHNTSEARGSALTEIAAYALMPTHVHIVLKQVHERGIATLMQKVFTGYTMYFNAKYSRTGALFSGTYKAKHVANDVYLKHVLAYVMMNPIELFEPRWKNGVGNLALIKDRLKSFPYASTQDFFGSIRSENALINRVVATELYDDVPTLHELLEDALEYYQSNASELDR